MTPQSILDFWFTELTPKQHFAKDPTLDEAIRTRFGATPQGIWPAEGAVSTALLEVLAEQKCRWTASGQGVLALSLIHI